MKSAQEIARNAQETASGTQVVSGGVEPVRRDAAESRAGVGKGPKAAIELNARTEELQTGMHSFLSKVRAT